MNQIPFPDKKYNVIYADPPWPFGLRVTHSTVRRIYVPYNMMSIEELCALPVERIAKDDSLLGTRGQPHDLLTNHRVRQLQEFARDKMTHSRKPAQFRDLIASMFRKDLPKIELFARDGAWMGCVGRRSVMKGQAMSEELRQRIIKTLNWMVMDMKWRFDDNKNNLEVGSQGGYSPELQEAINLLKELENENRN